MQAWKSHSPLPRLLQEQTGRLRMGPVERSPVGRLPIPFPPPLGRAAPVGEEFAREVGKEALLLLAFISDLPSPGDGGAFQKAGDFPWRLT